jgi:CO dehydrogenase maturation factor
MAGSIIAFSGKCGSGKTTLSSLVLRQLIRMGRRPILAVDADPNATMALTLGVPAGGTISDIRDAVGEAAQKPSEIPKERLMNQYLAEVLSEEEGFDLLQMGRPEGQKCYCYVNGLLRRYLSLLRESYAYVLVDCEAGMEYISRLVVDDVDTLVLVAEATNVGLTTVDRIARLTESLPIKVHRRVLAINKVGPHSPPASSRKLPRADAVVEVPLDEDVARRCAAGEPIDDQAAREARPAIETLVDHILGLSRPQAVAAQAGEH